MIFPTSRKRRTSRRNTSKNRPSHSTKPANYDRLELRLPLTTFFVTTSLDVVDAEDGLISLREAITASNSNAAFSDAPAGDESGDRIVLPEPKFDSETLTLDEIVLTQGELEITDDIVIRGRVRTETPSGPMGISSDNQSRIFFINTTERVRLHQVSLRQGADFTGGLIYAESGSDLVIYKSGFGNGSAEVGGAIFADKSRVHISESQFLLNQTTDNVDSGGAIYTLGSDVTIVGGEFSGNSAKFGGAVAAVGGELRLYGVNFGGGPNLEGNTAEHGGAVYSNFARLVSNSSYFGNFAIEGGAIFATAGADTHILAGSEFTGNGLAEESEAAFGSRGGAIYAESDGLYITDAVFEDNLSGRGGAIESNAKQAVFRSIDVKNNTAMFAGGGLFFEGDAAYVIDSNISNNRTTTAFSVGGGISVSGRTFDSEVQQDHIVVLRRVTLTGNSATTDGGGAYISDGAKLRVYGSDVTDNTSNRNGGGGIANIGSDLVVTGSNVSGNMATVASGPGGSGGGILASGDSSTLVFDSTFESNVADYQGGGIALNGGYARVANSNLDFNLASEGGGVSISSGKLVTIGGTMNSNQVMRHPDVATEFVAGGAVYVGEQTQFYARGTTFSSNIAENSGGAIFSKGLTNLTRVTLALNSSASGGALFLGTNSMNFVYESILRDNSVSSGNGAAIRTEAGSILEMFNSTVEGNLATGNEGGFALLFNRSSNWTISGGSILDNSPNDNIGYEN